MESQFEDQLNSSIAECYSNKFKKHEALENLGTILVDPYFQQIKIMPCIQGISLEPCVGFSCALVWLLVVGVIWRVMLKQRV